MKLEPIRAELKAAVVDVDRQCRHYVTVFHQIVYESGRTRTRGRILNCRSEDEAHKVARQFN